MLRMMSSIFRTEYLIPVYTLVYIIHGIASASTLSLSGVPDYFDRNKISSGGDLSHYSSASLY